MELSNSGLSANNVVDITAENFQQVIIEGSQNKLIIIDFFTQRSEQSISMSQTLANICQEYLDEVILAKVDCDQPTQQQIAMQFGIQNLPTVVLFKGGEVINGFAGGQAEAEVRKVLAPYLPKPEDKYFAQAKAQILASDFQSAFTSAKTILELVPDNVDGKKLLADACLGLGQNSEAETLLSSITLVDQDDYYHSLIAKLELNKQAAETPEIQALRSALAENPNDEESTLKLAIQLHQAQQFEEALGLLMAILRRDLNAQDGEIKKALMDILAAMPSGNEVATKVRRQLYSLLY